MDILLKRLMEGGSLTREDWITLIADSTPETDQLLFEMARAVRHRHYGRDVYIRGLIEISNYCKNDCLYCGIRRSNPHAERYRMPESDILLCCETGYRLGFRTFVLQGGEDPYFTDDRVVSIVSAIKRSYPDCAVTLSLGEKEPESYARFREAGADRYLLRHETANRTHYARLHPPELSFTHRQDCLRTLKALGYSVGAGFMVGSPGQTAECLADDMLFLQELKPQMVGIGPFLPHHDTPFAKEPAGSLELSLRMLALTRLLLPKVLLPATTALGSVDPTGRVRGILAGANVVMPNLSPEKNRGKYLLYDGKAAVGLEAAESLERLKQQMVSAGYRVVVGRGDPAV